MPEDQWLEVGPGVFQRRYEPLDVSIGVVLGTTGATVVDTRNNPKEGQEILADVTQRFHLPVVAVINTHAHYDHTFGNQVFHDAGIAIYGHHLIPKHFQNYEAPHLKKVQEQPETELDKEWGKVILTAPSRLIDQECTLDLGGREIQLVPLTAGHTDTDLAIYVPDASVWFLGDIVEESGPPMFGSGAHPLGWPEVLKELLTRIKPSHTVIPGHGKPINRDFVAEQQQLFESLAKHIRHGYEQGTAPEQLSFPSVLRQLWPEDFLREATIDGYAQLGD
ncbi:MBL fold metallo-hydrolase [Glutamicibacter sp.]|uniref:MBL fold metallo-hydrolase n=1 Tax=Glutamicibacter sp. TaxID=1931995 RepID=UPI002FE07446